MAHSHKDNTFLTSYFERPLELGPDIVAYSLTKYMNGHNDFLAGTVVVNNTQIYNELKFIQSKYGLIVSPFDCYILNKPWSEDITIANAETLRKWYSSSSIFDDASKGVESCSYSITITSFSVN